MDATFNEKEITLDAKTKVKLAIWDTAGQERYHAMQATYYRHSKGALIVYDITDKETFTKVKMWHAELTKYLPDAPIMIAGNKCDMPQRGIDEAEVTAYCRSLGAEHILTSAKTGANVKTVFEELARSKQNSTG